MKRSIAVLLCLMLVLLSAGCDAKEEPYGVDVKTYLKDGRMPEAQFALGTSGEAILEAGKARVSEAAQGGEIVDGVYVTQGTQFHCYTDGAIRYYCRPEQADRGISFLVNMDTAYGFDVGATTMTEIINALPKLKGKEGMASVDDLFFMMFSMGECPKLTYNVGPYELTFYFSNDLLFATTLENTELW